MTFSVGLVAHDERKEELKNWVIGKVDTLKPHRIFATGTTGKILSEACPTLDIQCLKSGPLGGDQQLGAMVSEGRLSLLVFFIDPLSPHPHDVDVKALIRLATLYNIPHACNEATANLIIKALD
jgi:methylglyoxal synthase